MTTQNSTTSQQASTSQQLQAELNLPELPVRIPEGVFDLPKEQAGLTGGTNPISELFAHFPKVTPEEAKKVIEHLRKYRKEMGTDGKPKSAAEKKPARAAAAKAKAAQAKQLGTDDLLAELGLSLKG